MPAASEDVVYVVVLEHGRSGTSLEAVLAVVLPRKLLAGRRSIYLHDRTDTRHEIKAGPRTTRGTTATGKVTLLHRFAGIRPTKPGNRSRGG